MVKSVHDAGWGILVRLITEKAVQHGRQVVVIHRWSPSTRTCSVCGSYSGEKDLSVREWTCTDCGIRLDRDYNAVNIMVAAGPVETLNACGGSIGRTLACADPANQEPSEQTPASAGAA